MEKDFEKWNEKKIRINKKTKRPFFRKQDIWFCCLGINVDFEQDGCGSDFLRPVIVFRKFNNEIFWAIPLTKTMKDSKYYFHFRLKSDDSAAILSQMRLVDAKKLSHKIGWIRSDDFNKLTKKLKEPLP